MTIDNKKDTKIFISLGQNDGRLINKEKYPFENTMCKILVCVYRLEKKET